MAVPRGRFISGQLEGRFQDRKLGSLMGPVRDKLCHDTAKEFIDMLDDSGMVQDRNAAEDLVGVLKDAEQDVDKVFNNFLDRTTSNQQQKAIQQSKKSRRSHRSRHSSKKQQSAAQLSA
ncbi:hypothetical protein FOZ62_014287 [Perkinsus olseni]|uniref:Uncharacterized protein n=1 Tax=Perkinsus olseni TaxID=32597 RepID=A0A7J6QAQ9_PEROL|nr:hypothetical protein FOZ62_014287 [Perkinsus olseni]